ncbi:MAG: twin-arginine translocase TatA/TatE family subunit [Microscillaceae bacterium]|nr:twin-arginine translocase TatA/TatE family subunit [Microscillaceae bacterium]MDW8460694.1 twin-arginine translocase TatA/TatE family subunit [Cytophagales bacterium]
MQLGTIPLFIGGLGTTEVLFIFLVILLLFGAKRIPELARSFGRGIREFKEATREVKEQIEIESKTIEKETEEVKKALK